MRNTAAIFLLGAASTIAAPHRRDTGILAVLGKLPLGPWSNTVPTPVEDPIALVDHFVDPAKAGQLAIGRSRKAKLLRRAILGERTMGLGQAMDDVLELEVASILKEVKVPQEEHEEEEEPLPYEVISDDRWSGMSFSAPPNAVMPDLEPVEPIFRVLGIRDSTTMVDVSAGEHTPPHDASIALQDFEEPGSDDLEELNVLMSAARDWTYQTQDFDERQGETYADQLIEATEVEAEPAAEDLFEQDQLVLSQGKEDSEMPYHVRHARDFYVWEGSDELSDVTDVPFW